MLAKLSAWFDDRTGCKAIVHEMLYERIPGGARWRYVWGSTLVFCFVTQVVTGIFLWMAYSPSATTAWESVYHIQNYMQGGWLLRGIHHFTAQAMIVLLAFHLLQVVWDGAYKAPREVNFWLGLVLMLIVLGLSLTGYLLPWDQKGYWATRVATNLMGVVPVVGEGMQELVVGGSEYGHHTVSRFFALHAGVLPGLLVLFLALHIAVFRRHGITAKLPLKRPDSTFWPDQVLKDGVACLAVLAVVIGLTVYFRTQHGGVDLAAPADRAKNYDAARPEWYFLFLFQFLKLFNWGEGWAHVGELVGAIVVPGVVVLVMFLMPFTGRTRIGHAFNAAFLLLLLAGAGLLTALAVLEDRDSQEYKNAVWVAEQEAELAQHLAAQGIPKAGAAEMMRTHPQAIALSVITEQCLQCHSYDDGLGGGFIKANPSAPNLFDFGRAEWAEGILDPERIASPHFFGNTQLAEGEMAKWVKGTTTDYTPMAEATDDEGNLLYTPDNRVKVAQALATEAGFADENDEDVKLGRTLIGNANGCAQCHEFRDPNTGGSAPRLTGWGSAEWLKGMISDPGGDGFYSHLDAEMQRMPKFEDLTKNLTPQQRAQVLDYVVSWLRREW